MQAVNMIKDGQSDQINDDSFRDTRLLERAVRERWPIDHSYLEAVAKRQVKIAVDPESSNRESTSAARCIVSMVGQNQVDEIRRGYTEEPMEPVRVEDEVAAMLETMKPKRIEFDGNGQTN